MPRRKPQDAQAAAMNAYARRIWDGQSPSLAVAERIARVKRGLAQQGWTDFDKLELPSG